MKVCIIGIGRFGYALASQLYEQGIDVLAIDNDKESINHVKHHATVAAITEISDEDSLRAVGVDEVETVIVAIGNNFAHSVLITRLLKKRLNTKRVIVRANDVIQKEVLELVGADKVILPEEDAAHLLADTLSSPFPFIIRLNDHFAITKIVVPSPWIGRSVSQIQLLSQDNLTCVGIERGGEIHHPQTFQLQAGDIVYVSGADADLRALLTT